MVGYARKRLQAFGVPPSSADPQDVVQIALTKVLTCQERVEKLCPYVFTVIKNEVSHAAWRYPRNRAPRPRADDRVSAVAAELAAVEAANRTVTADQVAERYGVSRRTGERLLAAARQHLQRHP
ncbi:hypothetical protein [Streptomyces sp. NBC_00568]|uniref:hypothetical protein n=1 Tax=Streptomyces sp. NBC_00568 TaxID=2975779 RepID=UPI002251E1BB|nr:hypothetical protein [Streptomyces sp. NBC_00568]MCX4993406.1 hypothetical protein [Streptomyces sp. NBC_00568]